MCKTALDVWSKVGVCDWESLGALPSMIQKFFFRNGDVVDAEVKGVDEIHPSKRPRVAERVPSLVPPEVEAENQRE